MVSAPSAPAELVSFRKFAKLAGVDEKTVRNAVRSGALPRNPGCLLPAALANSSWRARGARVAEISETSAPTLAEELRRREIALARLRRGQFQRRAAAWVSREMASDGWSEIVAHVRARLSQIAQAAAPLVIGRRPPEIQAALANVINAALTELSTAEERPRDEPAERDEPSIRDDTQKLDAERAKIAAIRASHELTLAIEAGAVVNIAAFTDQMGRHLSNLRTGLLNMQAILPPRLFLRDAAAAEDIIAQAVSELLADLPRADALLRSLP